VIRPTTRNAALVASLVLAALVASTAAAAPRIDAKRAEAERVLAQVQQIDAQLDLAVDAYNGAQIEVEAIEEEQRLNQRHLRIARATYRKAQAAVARRLIALYKEGDASFVEFLLGSRSVGELVDRLDTVERVSDQDVRIIEDIVSFRQEIRRRERDLRRART
jgi:peptidoglycan hydrolase CwlO-like protein